MPQIQTPEVLAEIEYLSSVRRRVLDVRNEPKVRQYLQQKGYTAEQSQFIMGQYVRGGRVYQPKTMPTPTPVFTWSGQVVETGAGQPTATAYFVRGQQVAKVSEGAGTTTLRERQRAQLEFPSGERVEVTPTMLTVTAPAVQIQAQERRAAALPAVQEQVQERERLTYRTFVPAPSKPIVNLQPFLFGEKGEKFVGVGGIGGARLFTFREIKSYLQETPSYAYTYPGLKLKETTPLPKKVLAEFIPTTPGEIGIGAGVVVASIYAPPVAKIAGQVVISGYGLRQAATPGLPTEKRIAAGIIGVAAGTALVAETLPFIRGAAARVSPQYKPVKVQPEGYKAITDVTEAKKIGIIQPKVPKGITGLKDSPLQKGGFGYKPGVIKTEFLGKEQLLATSQRGLFKVGKPIPIEKPFYVTPQEPTLKIPITRESRLGLVELFKFPEKVELGVSIPKPQIGIIKGTVAAKETPTAFYIGRTGELEAIKTYGILTPTAKIGVTAIKGQAVDIFAVQLARGVPKGISPVPMTTAPYTTVPFTTPLSTGLTTTTAVVTRPSPVTAMPSAPTSIYARPSAPTPISAPPTIKTYPLTPSPRIPIQSYPIGKTAKPSLPVSPMISIPVSPVVRPPAAPRTPFVPRLGKPEEIFLGQRGYARRTVMLPKPKPFGYSVYGRRFGVFKPLGIGRTEAEAFQIGKKFARTTLGATFKIPGVSGRKLPGYKTKYAKEGILYIEPRGRRLKKGTGEIPEIQLYRKVKGGRRKRR